MCKLLKVSGSSLAPLFQDGDYVLVAPPILSGGIRPGTVLAFRQPAYDIMIKRVERILPGNRLFVVGSHDRSVDSRDFGPISRKAVIGKVIWHIKRSSPSDPRGFENHGGLTDNSTDRSNQ